MDHTTVLIETECDDVVELTFDLFKITNESLLNKFNFKDCLNTKCLKEKLEILYLTYPDHNYTNFVHACESFGKEKLNNSTKYEHLAKTFKGYFKELLNDYVNEKSQNNLFYGLADFQTKLWNLQSGKLTCKEIKLAEDRKY